MRRFSKRATASRPETVVARQGTEDRAEKSANDRIAAAQRRVRLVAEDVDSEERTVLTGPIPWRAVEVLGSAANFYAAEYHNADRIYDQVRRRRDWAEHLGASIWDLAEAKVGIQTVTTDDLPPPPSG